VAGCYWSIHCHSSSCNERRAVTDLYTVTLLPISVYCSYLESRRWVN
jgi:hypothetical protein